MIANISKSNHNGGGRPRAALVVAHPSHELRIHGWLQRSLPRVFVLTDGSGRAGKPRLESTTGVLEQLGIQSGSIYGRFSDREVYDAFLRGNFSLFISTVAELAEQLLDYEIDQVVADSAEGYSPTHDACRLLTDAAVAIVARRRERPIKSFDFAVVAPPEERCNLINDQATWLELNDEEFKLKLDAARNYNAELALDVEAAMRGQPFTGVKRFSEPQVVGRADRKLSRQVEAAVVSNPHLEPGVKSVFDGVELNRFRLECLRLVQASANRQSEVKFYELYGEKMVAAGHYQETIRYAEHFLPVAEAVWRHVAGLSADYADFTD
jgi:hypothetical protein